MHNEEKPRPNTQGRKGECKREPLSPKGRRLKTTKMGAEKNAPDKGKKKKKAANSRERGRAEK